MSSPFRPGNAKWVDCRTHGAGSGAELILVEGDSALDSVMAVRNPQTQAVLALQGKPLNAWGATPARVARHGQFQLLAKALGMASPIAGGAGAKDQPAGAGKAHTTPDLFAPPEMDGVAETPDNHTARFERLVLLFDPDADGIHIGALMVLYVRRWLPALLQAGQLWQVRAPMFELVAADTGQVHQADHPAACQALAQQLTLAAAGAPPQVQAYRGLGSVSPAVLRDRCVDPATRKEHQIGDADVQAVIDVFGGGVRGPLPG